MGQLNSEGTDSTQKPQIPCNVSLYPKGHLWDAYDANAFYARYAGVPPSAFPMGIQGAPYQYSLVMVAIRAKFTAFPLTILSGCSSVVFCVQFRVFSSPSIWLL